MNSDNIGKKEIMVTHMHCRKYIKNNCRLSSLAYFPLKWPLWLSWFLGHRPHWGKPWLGKKGLTQNTNKNRVSDSYEPDVPLKNNYWNYYWEELFKRFLSSLTKHNILHVLCLGLLKHLFLNFKHFKDTESLLTKLNSWSKLGNVFDSHAFQMTISKTGTNSTV